MEWKEDLVVEGYLFASKEDAELAIRERELINRIESQIDFKEPTKACEIFEKAIEDRKFRTPVGLSYLQEIQKRLAETGIEKARIKNIPLYQIYNDTLKEVRIPVMRPIVKKREKIEEQMRVSLFLNIVLVSMVIAMFAITLNSVNPNILNYEKVLINRYEQWQSELEQREQAVQEKEAELNIKTP